VILVVIGLGLIVFLHELGHFLMAKKNKVRVEIFSLGFGQALFKFHRGETEYRIAWLPLGGYVKMAGETLMDERKGDSGELTSKTPWQRFQIFTAGALMNLLIAFPIAILAFVVGMYERSNEVGVPGVAETYGGLQPGDEIIDVDGRKIESLDKFHIEMVRRQAGTVVPVTVRRGGDVKVLQITIMKSEFHHTTAVDLMLIGVVPGSPLAQEGVQKRDEVLSVDGQRVFSRKTVDALLRGLPGKKVAIGIFHRDPEFRDTERTLTLDIPPKEWYVIPQDDRIIEPKIRDVRRGMPAAGKFEKGDLVTRIDGKEVHSWQDLKDAVEPSVNKSLTVEVLRNGKPESFSIVPSYIDGGVGGIGVGPEPTNVFADVRENSFFYAMGLRTGDKLRKIEGYSGDVTLWGLDKDKEHKVPAVFNVRDEKPRTLTIEVERRGEKELRTIKLVAEKRVEGDLAKMGFSTVPEIGILALAESQPFRKRALGEAMRAGVYEPLDVSVMTVEVLRKLVKGGEPLGGLSGPLGIVTASYHFAELSFGNFVWLMCLITVNLGIFNLLPIPVLDGGHNVLLAIEVVRKWFGKPPPSEKFVAAFQYTGLVFILALFVFVTYNDVSRFFLRG
jgi:regulator of sigma E protease